MRRSKQKLSKLVYTREAESAIFNNLPVGLLVFDENACVINANDYIFKTFHMDTVKPRGKKFGKLFNCKYAVLNKGTCQMMPACGTCTLMQAVNHVLAKGESRTGVEVMQESITDDRLTSKWFTVNISSVIEGMHRFALAAFTDITAKRQTDKDLSNLGITDELTGLYSRRYVLKKLDELTQANWPDAFPISVAMIDIDHFKRINERYKRSTGDYVLKGLADILKNYTRSADIVGRYGEDEFLTVFVKSDGVAAKQIITDIMDEFGKKMKGGVGEPVTFSTGLLSVGSTAGGICDINDYIHDAEELLNVAKHNGYNRIERDQEEIF